jgi:hypothetical protein
MQSRRGSSNRGPACRKVKDERKRIFKGQESNFKECFKMIKSSEIYNYYLPFTLVAFYAAL